MKKSLKEEIRSVLFRTIEEIPADYRCYEITRILKERFSEKSIKLYVIDGYAFYCFGTFLKEYQMGNCELFVDHSVEKDELIKAVKIADTLSNKQKSLAKNIYWKIGIRHSWAILAEENYLIDYHKSIRPYLSPFPILQKIPILKKLCVSNLLIISPFNKNLKDKAYICRDVLYVREAIQKGEFINYTDIDYTVKLRL